MLLNQKPPKLNYAGAQSRENITHPGKKKIYVRFSCNLSVSGKQFCIKKITAAI